MLRDHPEIRELFGHAPWTAFWCLLFSAAHLALAVSVSFGPWWVVWLCAYVAGSYFNLCLFNLAHDCNHGLVFNDRRWDRWLFTLTSLPMFMPGHHTWWIEHHVHHNDLGAKKDFVKRRRSIMLALKDNVFGHTLPRKLRPIFSWITTPLFWPIAIFMLVTQVLRAIVGLVVYAATDLPRGRWKPSDTTLAILADQHLVSGYKKYGIESWAVVVSVDQFGGPSVFAGSLRPEVHRLFAVKCSFHDRFSSPHDVWLNPEQFSFPWSSSVPAIFVLLRLAERDNFQFWLTHRTS